MEEATKAVAEAAANAAANATVEAVPEEPGGLGEPVVIVRTTSGDTYRYCNSMGVTGLG